MEEEGAEAQEGKAYKPGAAANLRQHHYVAMVIPVVSPELPPLSEGLTLSELSATSDAAPPSSLPTTATTGSSTGFQLHYTASTSTTSIAREEEKEVEGDKGGVPLQERDGDHWLNALIEDEQEPTIMFEAEEFSLFDPSHLMTMLNRDSLMVPQQGERQARSADISPSFPPSQEPGFLNPTTDEANVC